MKTIDSECGVSDCSAHFWRGGYTVQYGRDSVCRRWRRRLSRACKSWQKGVNPCGLTPFLF